MCWRSVLRRLLTMSRWSETLLVSIKYSLLHEWPVVMIMLLTNSLTFKARTFKTSPGLTVLLQFNVGYDHNWRWLLLLFFFLVSNSSMKDQKTKKQIKSCRLAYAESWYNFKDPPAARSTCILASVIRLFPLLNMYNLSHGVLVSLSLITFCMCLCAALINKCSSQISLEPFLFFYYNDQIWHYLVCHIRLV